MLTAYDDGCEHFNTDLIGYISEVMCIIYLSVSYCVRDDLIVIQLHLHI